MTRKGIRDTAKDRARAKEIYLNFRSRGIPINAQQFSARSEELLEVFYSAETINGWKVEDDWDGKGIELNIESKEVVETTTMLQSAVDRFWATDNDGEKLAFAKAIISICYKTTADVLEAFRDSIIKVKDSLYNEYLDEGENMSSSKAASFITMWADLSKIVNKIGVEFVEEGFDPDRYLLFGDVEYGTQDA